MKGEEGDEGEVTQSQKHVSIVTHWENIDRVFVLASQHATAF